MPWNTPIRLWPFEWKSWLNHIYIYINKYNYGGFHKWGYPMVYFMGNPSRNGWFRGTPPSMEPLYGYDDMIGFKGQFLTRTPHKRDGKYETKTVRSVVCPGLDVDRRGFKQPMGKMVFPWRGTGRRWSDKASLLWRTFFFQFHQGFVLEYSTSPN